MTTDWMELFLAGLIGASISWMLCSMWTMRWIERECRRMRDDTNARIEQTQVDHYELLRLKEQEKFNRERA
jgi:hypothetical protein